MPDISTTYAGLHIRTPLLAAAAGTTATVDRMRRAEEAGVGAICVKSLFESTIPRTGDPTPHMRVINPEGGGGDGWYALYSYEQAAHMDEYEYAELIHRAKRALSIPVIANIDCASEEAQSAYAQLVQEAGADAIEVKSCPHGEHRMTGDELASAVAHVRSVVQIPVIAKMPAQLTNPYRTALDLQESGADALVMFNRFIGLDIDVDRARPVMHGGFAGHGGPWSIYYRLRWIAQAAPDLQVPVCGTGGAVSGRDLAKYILAGATCVQVATAAIMEGYGAFTRILREFGEWMREHDHPDLDSVRGLAAARVLDIDEVDRTQTVRAEIDPLVCLGCGQCSRVCLYGGVREPAGKEDWAYRIDDACRGCGLCVQICPIGASHLVPLEAGEK